MAQNNSLKNWFLQNHTTGQILQGQFPAQSLTKNINPKWVTHTALSRSNDIKQFLNQEADTISFQALLFNVNSESQKAQQDIETIQSWAKPDPIYGNRPPVLTFWVGNGFETLDCIIQSVGGIQYGTPNTLGDPTSITISLTLSQYTEYSIEAKGLYETRYHRAVTRDYYELIAYREYKSPLLGDVIRKDHPSKPNIQTGDVIRLPSVEAVRKNKIATSSIVLVDAYSKKTTPTKTRRLEMLELRSGDYVSHIMD